jgi:hypothetical protein
MEDRDHYDFVAWMAEIERAERVARMNRDAEDEG